MSVVPPCGPGPEAARPCRADLIALIGSSRRIAELEAELSSLLAAEDRAIRAFHAFCDQLDDENSQRSCQPARVTDDAEADLDGRPGMQPVSCAGCQALQRRLRDVQAENERLARHLWAHRDDLLRHSALDFLSRLLRSTPVALALPP